MSGDILKIMKKPSQRKKILVVVAAAVALLIIMLSGYLITRTVVPERSIANFCTFRKAHHYDFNKSDYAELTRLYGELEKISPDDIRPEVKAIYNRYHELSSNSSNTSTVGLSLTEEVAAVGKYTDNNCSK